MLDPASGRKIQAIWHGAGAYHLFLSQKSSTENGQFRVAYVILGAWGHRIAVFSAVDRTIRRDAIEAWMAGMKHPSRGPLNTLLLVS